MKSVSKFDKSNLVALRAEMNELLSKYGADINIDFSVGNMKFSEAEVEIKVTAKVKGAKTFSNTLLETRVAALGLVMKNSLGDQLVDYSARNYRFPYIYIDGKDGKRYKCDERAARARFSKK